MTDSGRRAEQHFYLTELLAALHAGLVGVLTAYIDESEQAKLQVFAIGGYVFDRSGQRLFEWKWKRALKSKGLSRFHMTDFESGWGEFKGWSEKDRHQFFARIVEIIKSTSLIEFSVAIDLDAFSTLSADDRVTLNNPTAYSLCLETSFAKIAQRVRSLPNPEPVAYIANRVSRGAGKDRITAAWDVYSRLDMKEEYRLGSMSWGDSRLIPHLQAADIWAYEIAKAVTTRIGRSDRPIRESIKMLAHQSPEKRLNLFIGAEELRQKVEGVPSEHA